MVRRQKLSIVTVPMMPRALQPFQLVAAFAVVLVISFAIPPRQAAGQATSSVKASVEPAVVAVGESARYTITIAGNSPDHMPSISAPEELEFGIPAKFDSILNINGRTTISIRLSYNVESDTEGEYKIPEQIVTIDGQRFTTNAVNLTVKPSSGRKADNLSPFLEMKTSQSSFYVGQVVPLSVTLHTHQMTPLVNLGRPEMESEGFVLRDFPRKPVIGNRRIDDSYYMTSAFNTTISAIKPGKFTIGPPSIICILQVPDRRFGLHPLMGAESKRYRVPGEPLELEVKALPSGGRPDNFAGLVGNFEMSTAATPMKLKVGDPISITLTVLGQGNLDELSPLELSNSDGWRVYPATKLGQVTGAPTGQRQVSFNHVIIPEKITDSIPPFELPFFDPKQERYVIMKSATIPIEVLPADKPIPSSVRSGAAIPGDSGNGLVGPAAKSPTPIRSDILSIRTDTLATASAEASLPPHRRTSFFLWQVIPAVIFGIIGFGAIRRWVPAFSGSTNPLRELTKQIDSLESFTGGRGEFYRRAHEAIAQSGQSVPEGELLAIVRRHETMEFGSLPDQQAALDKDERKTVTEALRKHLLNSPSQSPQSS